MKVFARSEVAVPSLLCAALACTWTGAARAEIGLSAEPQVGFVAPSDPELLVGGAVRGGYAFDSLYPILVMPELSLDAHYVTGDAISTSLRVAGGIRVGLLAVVEPSIYVHAGYGALRTGFIAPELDLEEWASTFTLDAGASVDYRIQRWLTVGASLGYLGYFEETALHGGLLGLHLSFWL